MYPCPLLCGNDIDREPHRAEWVNGQTICGDCADYKREILAMTGAAMRIRNWDELQSHNDGRRIIWTKLHATRFKDSRAWIRSNDRQRFDMLACIMFSADQGLNGDVPDDAPFIKDVLRLDKEPNLQHLLDVQFLTGERDQGEEIREEKSRPRECHRALQPVTNVTKPEFAMFWDAYPKKRGKADATKAWKATAADRPLINQVLEALNNASQHPDWLKNDGQYIPLPATGLRGHRWEDDICQQKPAVKRQAAVSARGVSYPCPQCGQMAPTFKGAVCTSCANVNEGRG